MTFVNNLLEHMTALYAAWFGDWLHISFAVRTAILVLALWGALFIAALVVQYIFGPLFVIFYRHTFFRAWNYFFVETPQEWMFLRHYSKAQKPLKEKYFKLTEKIKTNRGILATARFKAIIKRGTLRRVTLVAMAIVGVAASLWVSVFGLNQEYYVPAFAPGADFGVANGGEPTPPPENHQPYPTPPYTYPNDPALPELPVIYFYPEMYLNPALLEIYDILHLNEAGEQGARLRLLPSFDAVILQMLWGDVALEFLGDYTADGSVPGLYWLRVRTAEGTVGYIASQLIR